MRSLPHAFRRARRRFPRWPAIVIVVFSFTQVLAQPSVDPELYELSLSKGMLKFNQARYQEAETFFRQALEAKPDDPEAAYYLGQSLLRAKKYADAEGIFQQQLQLHPTSGRARLGLGIAQYYQSKYRDALNSFQSAQAELPKEPLVYYFQGLAYNRLGAYDKAAPLFSRAMELGPELSPEGHYQRGLARYGQGIYDDAKAEFEAAIAADPNSELAQSARWYLQQVSGPGARPIIPEPRGPVPTPPGPVTPKRWDLSLSVSAQYDSNVVLLPLGTQPPGGPSGISRRDDYRTVLFGRGEYRFLQSDAWTIGSGYGLYQSFHRTLSAFDVQNHTPYLYVQHRLGRIQTRLDYIFDHISVGREPFLVAHAVRPAFTVREGDRWFTQFYAGYQDKDFKNDRFPLNSTRNARNWLFGVTQFYHFADNAGVARLGYIFDTDRTGGGSPTVALTPSNADWAYTGHRLTTGVTFPPVWTVIPGLTFDYYRQNYDNPNSFSPGGRTVRQDDIYIVTAALTRNLTSSIAVSLQYSYTRDKANVPLFDYERMVYALTLSGNF